MISDELLAKVKMILEETNEVTAGYLFGSIKDGYEHKKSDIDIAVLFSDSLDKFQQFELEIKLGNRLQDAIKRKVDLLVLNRAEVNIAFNAIRGILVFERDLVKRSLFEAMIQTRYYQQKHYQQLLAKILFERAGNKNYEFNR